MEYCYNKKRLDYLAIDAFIKVSRLGYLFTSKELLIVKEYANMYDNNYFFTIMKRQYQNELTENNIINLRNSVVDFDKQGSYDNKSESLIELVKLGQVINRNASRHPALLRYPHTPLSGANISDGQLFQGLVLPAWLLQLHN
ncbi:4493_t:CDS:2 [Scutellospora calospora]|uniref:4493_t:CDS:1 n=1 Tax=Scutellospora calospora TaxID=85575 RepID=A0ACA9KIC3_9GLOM|nr:4493_t:CDS:2 [Scutellospora calospora]